MAEGRQRRGGVVVLRVDFEMAGLLGGTLVCSSDGRASLSPSSSSSARRPPCNAPSLHGRTRTRRRRNAASWLDRCISGKPVGAPNDAKPGGSAMTLLRAVPGGELLLFLSSSSIYIPTFTHSHSSIHPPSLCPLHLLRTNTSIKSIHTSSNAHSSLHERSKEDGKMDSSRQDLVAQFVGITGAKPASVRIHIFLTVLHIGRDTSLTYIPGTSRPRGRQLEPPRRRPALLRRPGRPARR